MKLQHLANQRIIISRMQPISGSSAHLAMATVTAAFGHLQPVAAEKVALIDGVMGKSYKIFLDNDVDIQEGDQLVDEQSNIYTVTIGGVTRWRHGAMDYQEVVIQKTGVAG